MGPMIGIESEIVLALGVTATLRIFGPAIGLTLGLPPTLLSAAMVAVVAVAYLAVCEIISWEDLKGVSWGIFFIIGAGLSLGEALVRTGVTDWVASALAPLINGTPLLVSMLTMTFLTALLTNLLNNTTIAAEISGTSDSFMAPQVRDALAASQFSRSYCGVSNRVRLDCMRQSRRQ
jgi:sodium-dependent dicarboxylate transporter 2/3/5